MTKGIPCCELCSCTNFGKVLMVFDKHNNEWLCPRCQHSQPCEHTRWHVQSSYGMSMAHCIDCGYTGPHKEDQ
jgi:hypothetical protein